MKNTHDRLTLVVLYSITSLGLLFFIIPVLSLLLRIPWSQSREIIIRPEIWLAIRTSFIVTISVVMFSLLIGFPIAWSLTQLPNRLARIVRVLVLLPMVLPPVVGGVALLSAFGANTPLGSLLGSIGIHIPFTTLGAILAVSFVSAPFMIVMLDSGFQKLDPKLADAASVLGASRWMLIRKVLIPGLRPAILGGVSLTWARALGEFGATIAFAGNRPGHTQTLPLAIYQALQSDLDRAVLISSILIFMTLALMIFVKSQSHHEDS